MPLLFEAAAKASDCAVRMAETSGKGFWSAEIVAAEGMNGGASTAAADGAEVAVEEVMASAESALVSDWREGDDFL